MSANWSSLPRRSSFKTSTAVGLRQEMPGALRIATRYVESVPDFPVSRLTLATLSRLVISLLIGATIVIVLTNPGSAQAPAAWNDATTSQHDRNLFAQCIKDWDRATHMTKTEWMGACQRLIRDRADPAQASQQFLPDGQRRVR